MRSCSRSNVVNMADPERPGAVLGRPGPVRDPELDEPSRARVRRPLRGVRRPATPRAAAPADVLLRAELRLPDGGRRLRRGVRGPRRAPGRVALEDHFAPIRSTLGAIGLACGPEMEAIRAGRWSQTIQYWRPIAGRASQSSAVMMRYDLLSIKYFRLHTRKINVLATAARAWTAGAYIGSWSPDISVQRRT